MDKNKYTIVAIILVIFTAFGIYLLVNKDPKPSTQTETTSTPTGQDQYNVNNSNSNNNNNTIESVNPPAQVSFVEPDLELNQNQEHTSTLSFTTLPDPAPTAYTLVLSYDPNQLEVTDIQPGNLWTGENILEKDIDNNSGTVKFSVGQGFSDEVSGDTQIAKVTFINLRGGDSTISITEDSVYTSVEQKVLIPMQGLPLSISVE